MNEETNRYQTFPLRISPSLRQQATEFAEGEGMSLNHLINMAVAEKVSRMTTKARSEGEGPYEEQRRPALVPSHKDE
jgi:hypothetical protein